MSVVPKISVNGGSRASWFRKMSLCLNDSIIPVTQNVSIRWEINFYDKKYFLGQGNIGAKLIFPKYLFWAYIGGLKVKSDFSTYFSIESSNPKNIFCIINLVQWQVYRVEKVGKNLLYLSKKTIFKFFHT